MSTEKTVSGKTKRLRESFTSLFEYPKDAHDTRKILRAKGRDDVERITNAFCGNCFDTNKIAYILLQQSGIPCRFVNGYPEGTDTEDHENQDNGTRGDHREKFVIRSAEAHAFVRYFDQDTQRWEVLDVTPEKKYLPSWFDRWSEAREAKKDIKRKCVSRVI